MRSWLRPLPYQVPPCARGVGTRQPSVGPLFTRNAVPSLSCRTATLVTVFSQCNIHTFHCCLLLLIYSFHCCLSSIIEIVLCKFLCTCTTLMLLMLLVNNAMPPKKMQYEIIYQPTDSAIWDISHSNKWMWLATVCLPWYKEKNRIFSKALKVDTWALIHVSEPMLLRAHDHSRCIHAWLQLTALSYA